jgi:hypothetical protein
VLARVGTTRSAAPLRPITQEGRDRLVPLVPERLGAAS